MKGFNEITNLNETVLSFFLHTMFKTGIRTYFFNQNL